MSCSFLFVSHLGFPLVLQGHTFRPSGIFLSEGNRCDDASPLPSIWQGAPPEAENIIQVINFSPILDLLFPKVLLTPQKILGVEQRARDGKNGPFYSALEKLLIFLACYGTWINMKKRRSRKSLWRIR
jgi:hypothetical protein